ncbi:cytochrome aa3 quinol oxidase subunit I [Aneurinibacillus sp. Ricciae_BoGa-3]|uniref:cytochrome aa3 quinol oxidase subunit I n=1 Tax=Aneurinibacillus sp. Ricciae_BoGa-3 TaxID=3022697 RepID=UPI00234103C2|nr:cytochrome aa3 quinol oxidase subunit I [Aneurinibacillus sp. Ricciae_BoGa-3]WCK54450.1 cytochrome aa3 quinol oxidase subunit I [Aneurinibacillus sp. Ricciae_BoGa-3]
MSTGKFFVTGDPLIYGADVSIVLVTLGILFVLTYFKKWGWLWREWLTTVDHKRIGVMYMIAAIIMFFRGGSDAVLMRLQLAAPNMKLLNAEHYDQIFSTHGTVMILFMAMPFVIGLMNIGMPLQIGARDVAFPVLNALSFWLFFMGAMLLNISFVIGGSPDTGWTSYAPLAEALYSPGVGEHYYLLSLQISGIGTLASGINFLVTIIKMRAPGMTLMRMPMFSWSVLITSVIIIYAFPVLTVALAMLSFDRLFGAHFFTVQGGGMPMMWANLFWIWGHPEVYIVALPAFGVFSDVVSTFSRRTLFGYSAMVVSMVAIAVLSFIVWLHHFFTMGAGPAVNAFFGISTMAIAIPTGVKLFNWLLTMYKGRIKLTVAMLWVLAFIPTFAIGGLTGVMLAMAPADYQYHNSYFLIAHFHNVLISATVFAAFAGMHYWWPKLFGFKLNERIGRWYFWFFSIGYIITFAPQYVLGLLGMTRRVYTYPPIPGWTSLNMLSTFGTILQSIGFILMVYMFYWSVRYEPRTFEPDPWDGRTLEWLIPSPAPHYNFSRLPEIKEVDVFWHMKKRGQVEAQGPIQPIHMPSSSGRPFIMSIFFFIAGFGLVFMWWWMAFLGLAGILLFMVLRAFEYDDGYYVSVDEIKRTENITEGV